MEMVVDEAEVERDIERKEVASVGEIDLPLGTRSHVVMKTGVPVDLSRELIEGKNKVNRRVEIYL